MLLEPVIVHSANVGNGVNAPTVFIVLVFFAIGLIAVDHRKNFNEILPGMWDVTEQFIIELQYPLAVTVGIPLVIDTDVFIQLFLCLFQLGKDFGVKCPPNRLGDCRPWVDLYGGNLHQCQKHQQKTATIHQKFLQLHILPPSANLCFHRMF